MKSLRETVVAAMLLVAIYALFAHCAGCDMFASHAARALDVAGYTVALAQCRGEGKEAGSYAVYETCAHEADVKYGVPDGGVQ